MGPQEVQWIRTASHRFDRDLRHLLIEMHRPAGRLSCLLQGPSLAYRYRFSRIPVIIQLAPECSHADRLSFSQHLARSGCRHVRHHSLINCVSAHATVKTLRDLAEHPHVRKIGLDREVQALLDVAAPTLRVPSVWNAGVTGRGVVVAVIDTGIYPHPDLTTPENRIVAFTDRINGREKPYDDNGHGTHVAGIVAGNGYSSKGRLRGIAPEARLVGVKVLDRWGSGRFSTLIDGIEWCVRNRELLGIRVLSLSLGAPAYGSWRDDPLALAVGAAWQAGLVVCCAAGNDGPDPSTISTPGIHPAVITVGATDDHGTADRSDDTVAPFSSRGPTPDGVTKPDVVLPGVEITSLLAPGSVLAKQQGQPGNYTTLSGTSMATPMASGLAALTLERHPSATPEQVKRRLLVAAQGLGEPANVQGWGEVDGFRAVLGPEPASASSRPRSELVARRREGAAVAAAR